MLMAVVGLVSVSVTDLETCSSILILFSTDPELA